MREFVFWQGMLSIHQSAMLRNLADSCDVSVTLVVWEELSQQRKGLGWYKPDFGKTRVLMQPTLKRQSELLTNDMPGLVHVFSGTRGHPKVWTAFCQSLSSKAYIAIQSEAQNGMGFRGMLRLIRSKYDSFRFRERVNCIYGIGGKGVEWFKRSGYIYDRIFPFGYFTEMPTIQDIGSSDEVSSDRVFDLIFVGRPLFNKGLDILINALHELSDAKWRLHIVGDSDDKDRFTQLCELYGLSDAVNFYGMLANLEVLKLIRKSDLLVLPSRWDGWGAVVNEALMCGVPAVCSDKCGAADLLDGHERGEVFPADSVDELRSVLNRWISLGKKDIARSEKIKQWSKCISGKVGADYFMEVINSSITGGAKPVPPWFN